MGSAILQKSAIKRVYLVSFSVGLLSLSGNLMAADDFDYHPVLSDNFTLSLGAFKSSEAFSVGAEGTTEEFNRDRDIDFSKVLGVDSSSTLFNGQFRWKFGKQRKWFLAAQYFGSDASGSAVLNEDVEWQDVTFREGTNAGAGVEIDITRLFLGRSLYKNQQHDFSIGIGIHNLDLSTYIEGEIKINDETTEFQRVEANASQPLPNVGALYNYSPARKWLIHGRVDWISANISGYDGTLWNTNIGVGYQAFRHVGFDLAYQYFNLNLKVDKTDWKGGVDLRYSGPVLAINASW